MVPDLIQASNGSEWAPLLQFRAYNPHIMQINVTYLKWLILMGLIEGTSTLVLFFVAMPMKYIWGHAEVVSIVGGLHGILFLGLVAMFIVGWSIVPISGRMVIYGIIGAIVPFGPFVVDVMLYRILQENR